MCTQEEGNNVIFQCVRSYCSLQSFFQNPFIFTNQGYSLSLPPSLSIPPSKHGLKKNLYLAPPSNYGFLKEFCKCLPSCQYVPNNRYFLCNYNSSYPYHLRSIQSTPPQDVGFLGGLKTLGYDFRSDRFL